MTHPMSDLFRRQVKDFSEFTTTERKLIADELDRLHGIEQEAILTRAVADAWEAHSKASSKLFRGASEELFEKETATANTLFAARAALAAFDFSTREAALAAAKGTT